MSEEPVQVDIKGLLPTPGGAGVFLSDGTKAMTIFIDPMVSRALGMTLQGEEAPRPLTHDLLVSVFSGLGVSLRHVVINACEEETYFARLHLEQENELGKSLVEVDARPSDCLVLAAKLAVPVFVAREVWDAAEDMTWAIDQLESGGEEE